VVRSGASKRIAVEHTDYFNDTEAGKCSPLTPIDEFWKLVQSSLMRRISHRKHLAGMYLRVGLKEHLKVSAADIGSAKKLAADLVGFMETNRVDLVGLRLWQTGDFREFPILHSLTDWLVLSPKTCRGMPANRTCWVCSNTSTGYVRLCLKYVITAIENKNKKAAQYDWQDAKERWLLITAGGAKISNSAGGNVKDADWINANLTKLSLVSPFDRIVFWDRAGRWYKWLKPDQRIMPYGNP